MKPIDSPCVNPDARPAIREPEYCRRMRWEQLFDDLEGQLSEAERAEEEAEIADRIQREQAMVSVADRLRSGVGQPVDVRLMGAERVVGELTAVGADWIAIADSVASEVVVATAAALTIRGLPRAAAVGTGSSVSSRLRLGYPLRQIMRSKSLVTVGLVDGFRCDGKIAAVGADYVDVIPSGVDESTWPLRQRERTAIPFARVAAVRYER